MDAQLSVDGDSTFVGGLDGYTEPGNLNPGEYSDAMNVISRGGVVQTRPGSVSLFDLPDGNIQGCTLFTPSSGTPHLVFAVEGKVYVSPFPFETYSQLANIQFYHASKYVAWASCIKSTDYDAIGVITPLATPISVLVMQDGVTRAAYWDGTNNGHLNPTKASTTGSTITLPGYDETPIGLWMKWSNNRLWVSAGSKVFASDIGNPLKFWDTQYLANLTAFYMPGECTGAEETADQQGVVFFTDQSATLFQSAIQDRTQWASTPKFQQTILPGLGCVAPRSIVKQYGQLWWYTHRGLICQDDALRTYITSRMDVRDNEMLQSKRGLCYDLSMVCGGFYENFLFHAVPNASLLNNRIHVLDQAPFEQQTNAWASYWTGWRPVEFARGVISTQERVFFVSSDYDGVNRMWEFFRPEKTDNGMPITSYVVTRSYYFGNRDDKDFSYMEAEFQNLEGSVAVMGAVATTRGAFQKVMGKDVSATIGQAYASQSYGFGSHVMSSSKPQTRLVISEEGSNSSDCNDGCVESDTRGLSDKAFTALFAWSGIAGLRACRLFSTEAGQPHKGICENDETGETRLLTPNGCGVTSLFSTKTPFTTYFSTKTYTSTGVSHTSTQSSVISQADADRKALKMAEWYVNSQLGVI